jgi:TRAP transporter 4TM/12TM fusion protein
MPPIMGAAAFIMAEFLEVPYSEVVKAAVVPSVMYYVCLFSQIDAYARRLDLRPRAIALEVPPVLRTVSDNLHIVLSFVVLVLLLFLLRMDSQGPWLATALAFVMAMCRRKTRLNLDGFVGLFESTGRILGELIGIIAPLGMVIGSLVITGAAYSLPHEIVGLAGGSRVVMLLLGALASFVLGMGVSISAVYIFLAIVLAPGLVQGGFDVMAVHLFVLYTAMLSYITPPVALAAFTASAISGASAMRTGVEAMKLGIAKYILPFVFVASPALILRGPWREILVVIPTCLVGLVIISGALEGYFWRLGTLTMLSRVLLFCSGILLAVPGVTSNLFGFVMFAFVFCLAYILRGRIPAGRLLVKAGNP